jgi:hypothetical protein
MVLPVVLGSGFLGLSLSGEVETPLAPRATHAPVAAAAHLQDELVQSSWQPDHREVSTPPVPTRQVPRKDAHEREGSRTRDDRVMIAKTKRGSRGGRRKDDA